MRNETILKIGKNSHHAKAIAFAKWSVWVKNENCEEHAKNSCRSTLQLYYAKNGSKKQLRYEKWDHSENWQKWPQWKGHSLCKMVSLGQKLKMPKTCDKRLYKHIRLVLCKKRLQKPANVWEVRPLWELAKTATMQWLWPLQSGQFRSKIKIAKSMRKTAVEANYSCIMQKTAPKNS